MMRSSLITLAIVLAGCHAAPSAPRRTDTESTQHPLAYASLPYEPETAARIPPSLPDGDYAFSFKQHKWNYNGAGVNHMSTGTWYSSLSQAKVLVTASTLDWASDNATLAGELTGAYTSSLFDYADTSAASKANVKNYYFASDYTKPVGTGTCNANELPIGAAQGQLLPPDFLRQNGIYAGTELLPQYGQADKWVAFFGPGLALSFYFVTAIDGHQRWVRYDQYSQGEQTTVVTEIFNLRENAQFKAGLFNPCKQ